ncbi:MAG: hypothetical protein JWO67_1183 [Streptosporangiaceae bacterium]|nr:hypothetical protein [Streptosporangiaceae bacterium]
MSGNKDPRTHKESLVEPQGVNAGPAIDEDVVPPADEDPPAHIPDELPRTETLSGEAVGLPGQKPGYPGQQRSVDTS